MPEIRIDPSSSSSHPESGSGEIIDDFLGVGLATFDYYAIYCYSNVYVATHKTSDHCGELKVLGIFRRHQLFFLSKSMAWIRRIICFAFVTALVSACASPDGLEDIHDPYETVNRRTHELNRSLDAALMRPVSQSYASVVPEPVLIGISNFSNFLDLPAIVVNDLLQFDFADAVSNSTRFVVNGTVGIVGLYDAASDMGLYHKHSDFGETMHVWGIGEGAYVELPVIGGSTERDTVGIVINALFNPMTMVLEDYWKLSGTGIKTLDMIGERGRFGDTVDSVLYDSADSYAQSRLYYLQSRRHELGMELDDDDYFDPYEDF